MRKTYRLITLLLIVAAMNIATRGTPTRLHAQTATADLNALTALIPIDAVSPCIEEFTFGDTPTAYVHYTREEYVELSQFNAGTFERDYDIFYRWTDSGWVKALDSYVIAEAAIGEDMIGAARCGWPHVYNGNRQRLGARSPAVGI